MARHDALIRELRVALLAEFGAREIYARLSSYSRDPELAGMLGKLELEQIEVIDALRKLITELGDRPKRSSFRRALLARALALWARPFGPKLPLRISADAEETRARWYGHFQEYLVSVADEPRARVCHELQVTKIRHSNALHAWLDNG